jgi:hypothetical protein
MDRLEVTREDVSNNQFHEVLRSVRATLPEFAPDTWDPVGGKGGSSFALAVSEENGSWCTLLGQEYYRDLGDMFRDLLWEPGRSQGYNMLYSAKLNICDQHEPGYPGLDVRIDYYWAKPASVLDAILEDER